MNVSSVSRAKIIVAFIGEMSGYVREYDLKTVKEATEL